MIKVKRGGQISTLTRHSPYICLSLLQTTMSYPQVSPDVRRRVDTLLQSYGHEVTELNIAVIGALGAGKSATVNTLLGEQRFLKGCAVGTDRVQLDDMWLMVVDTPGSWDTQVTGPGPKEIDFYIFVINLESPRFEQKTLDYLLSLKGRNGELIMSTGHCLVVLTHADKVLQFTSLDSHLSQTEGNPLHTFLTVNMQNRVLAINATANGYEQQRNQRALLNKLYVAQRNSKTEGVEKFAGIICMIALNIVFLLVFNSIFRKIDANILVYSFSVAGGQWLLLWYGIHKQVADFMAANQYKGVGGYVRLVCGLIFHLLFNLFWSFIFIFVNVCKMFMGQGRTRKEDQPLQPFVNVQGFLTGLLPKREKVSNK